MKIPSMKQTVELKLSDLKVGGRGGEGKSENLPPPSKLSELRVNSLLFNVVNESSLGLSYVTRNDLL